MKVQGDFGEKMKRVRGEWTAGQKVKVIKIYVQSSQSEAITYN